MITSLVFVVLDGKHKNLSLATIRFNKFGVVPFETGSSFLLNISNRHTVINKSNEYRYHIIVHHLSIKDLDSLVLKSYNKSYAS